ncbi:type IX secretion system membrane protein PorP/SprF [Yeosuana sp. MJ-SS3]|uniref:Type IX secretion system membrane protein PorP/SprF n=1 Tax=Gilvirhabdus luticola TaxID=3079858 RepID=A0ABU3U7S2_9FLAO|nr:type IX secretion system membrane protein PorP/SprF [Yeosuana sp. MJ-SS3]MDU8886465.1 type IX secretion system membrane protein PorP/SprF [Yeosuana sp. MJ-SS3]
MRHSCLAILLLNCFFGFSQIDTLPIKNKLAKANEYRFSEPEKSIELYNEIIEYSDSINFPYGKHKGKIGLGISYRLDESVSGLGLVKLANWIHFGYAYEATTTDVKDYSKGSHEVLLRFRF